MKKRKMFSQQVLWILSIILLIPLFINAQDTDFNFTHTDINGKANYFPLESFEYERPEYSRTEAVQMPGWPINIGVSGNYPPCGVCLADIYEDGSLAVIIGSSNGVFHVFNHIGNDLPGWPKIGIEPIRGKAAVADIDPDYPGLEIVVGAIDNLIYAWHNDGTDVPGWPIPFGGAHMRGTVISDIDGDGDLEIIIAPGSVHVFNHDGTIYPGWPQSIGSVATPSVADVDNDGFAEICAVSATSIYLWDKDGNPKPGWPLLNVSGSASYAQPTFADLDDDGDLEILHVYYDQYNSPSDNYIGIYHHDGTNFENWPQIFPHPRSFLTPIVGDLDNDGDLEIIGGRDGTYLYAKHHTGGTVAGWPVSIPTALECTWIVFDLDDDGSRDVLAPGNGIVGLANMWAFHGDGSAVEDWPIDILAPTMVNSPAVGDVDGDGDIEIALVVLDGTVNLWTLEDIPYRSYLTEWGTWFHDNWNTGWFHPKAPQELTYESSGSSVTLDWNTNSEPDIAGYNVYRSDTEGGPYTKLNNTLITDTSYNYNNDLTDNYYCITAKIYGDAESRLSTEVFGQTGVNNELTEPIISLSNYPNPFNPTTTISFSVTQTSPFVTLEIFNIRGQKVRQLISSLLSAGQHSVVWNGKDDNNQPVSSGIYFYKLKAGKFSDTKRMILIK